MSEFSFSSLPSEPKSSSTYKTNGNIIEVVETALEKTLGDGTYIRVAVYASRANAVPTVGDLLDYDSQYTVTVDKVI